MANESKCLKCGAPLTPDARDGVCPKCLLALALAGEPGEESSDPAPSPPVITEGPGTIIGRYKLIEKIGEGGFGVVYMAEQEEPVRRRVALKIIKLGMDTREVIARFEAERQALALMDHPNIAKVFDGGATDAGRPYFVMELVRGVRITDYCDRQQFSPKQRLQLFMQVCQAVQHAHQKGIIHRDLKPSNVLVTVNDGVPVPKVIDFGIAKATGQRLTDKTFYTRFHQFLGTPAYMSPEQVELTGADIDTRSDIYSLGVLLYELLTGKTPFDAQELLQAGVDEMRRRIREEEPPKPSTRLTQTLVAAEVSRRILEVGKQEVSSQEVSADSRRRLQHLIHLVRGDLDWIVMKALEKDRSRRYETASALASDIGRHLNSEPVVAGPPSQLYRFQKFVRRNKVTVSAATAIAVVLVLGVVASTWQWRRAVEARRGEAEQWKVAETNALERREQLVRLDVATGARALDNGDWFGALLWFTEALRQDQPGSRAEEMHRYRLGAILHYAPRLTQLWFHRGTIRQAAFSPDGRWALTTGFDQTARLWDSATGAAGAVLRHATNVSQAAFSGDGRRVLTVSFDGLARVWDPASGELACLPLKPGYRIEQAVISPDGRRVFTVGDPSQTNLADRMLMASHSEGQPGELRIWDATTGQSVRSIFRGMRQGGQDLALSPDGQWLAASFAESLLVWNLRQPQAIRFAGGDEPQATVLPGLKTEATSSEIEASFPEIPPGRKSRPRDSDRRVACIAFSPDNQQLVVGYSDDTALVWPLRVVEADARRLPAPTTDERSKPPQPGSYNVTPVVLQRPKSRQGPEPRFASRVKGAFRGAAVSPDSRRVLLVDGEGIVRRWNARTAEAEGEIKANAGSEFAFSPDGRLALLSAQVWDMMLDEPVSPRPLQSDLRCAAFSPDGARLLTGGAYGSVQLWSLASGQLPPFKHDEGSVAASQDDDGGAATATGPPQAQRVVWRETPQINLAAFSPDGRRVLTLGNKLARVWDAANGDPVTPFVKLDYLSSSGAFSSDGTRFAAVGGDYWSGRTVARVWDAATGQPVTPSIPLAPNWPWGTTTEFSPDGRWLITRSEQEGAQLWDARTGEPGKLPLKLEAPARSFGFSADGRLAAVCTAAGGTGGNEAHSAQQNGEDQSRATSAVTRVIYQTRLWNLQTGQPASPPLAETNGVTQWQFSPDGRWLLTVGRTLLQQLPNGASFYDVSTRLWMTSTGRFVSSSLSVGLSSDQVVFSRDGRYLCVVHGKSVSSG